MTPEKRVIIMGAAGRDFHNFNVCYRDNPEYRVVAFTATQIPGIANRTYPRSLSGERYPEGIPIYPEEQLPELIQKLKVDIVTLAYSDLAYEEVMRKASLAMSEGPNFVLLGPDATMLHSKKPVVAVTGVRTGVGKSPTTRRVAQELHRMGKKVVIVRHPMPYGPWEAVQRFAEMKDLAKHHATIEEMEEYAPIIASGNVVYAGVDYEAILREAEEEADVVVWDGGNNDLPFFKPDLYITVADARRPGHEIRYYPGEINLRAADVVVVSKVDSAKREAVETVVENIKSANPNAEIILGALELNIDYPSLLKEKRVVVVEDGPTLTHGGMSSGAGCVAATRAAATILDPRPYAIGEIREAYEKYPHIGNALPALGYSAAEMHELETTINAVPADFVVLGTPVDLRDFLHLNKPVVRVQYELKEMTHPDLGEILRQTLLPAPAMIVPGKRRNLRSRAARHPAPGARMVYMVREFKRR